MYNILKFNPIRNQLSYELSFYSGWQVFNGIQESDEDYMHSGFGKSSDDVLHVIQHMAWLSRRLETVEDAKQSLLNDFQNLLICLPFSSSANEYVKAIIPYLIDVELSAEVGQIIERYYYDARKKENLSHREALSYPDLYEQAGDNALFLHNDPETALLYYFLAGVNWKASYDYDNRSASQRKLEKEVNIYKELLNCEFPSDREWTYYSSKLSDSYAKALYVLNNSRISDITSLDVLVDEVEKIPSNNRRLLRIGYLMIEGIRRNHALKIIYAVSCDKTRAEYDSDVLSWAEKLYDRRYKKLVDAIKENDRNKEEKLSIVYSTSEASCLVDHILDFLRVDNDETIAAYYTSLKTFSYMLPDNCSENLTDCGKLSVMHLSYMNDPNEGKTIQKAIFGKVEENKKTVNPPYVFLKCFTSMKDYLPMWNMYADSAKGICIEIETKGLNSLYHVCYVDEDNEIKAKYNTSINYAIIKDGISRIRKIAKKLDQSIMDDLLGPIRYLFKDKSYSYEQEIRMVFVFDRLNSRIRKTPQDPPKLMVMPKETIQIKEIMLGPKFLDIPTYLPYIQEQLDRMAEITNTEVPDITLSSIDFR